MEQDEAKAIAYYQKAAFHGHGGACNNLGYLYNNGSSTITRDPQQARMFYKAGALKGTGGGRGEGRGGEASEEVRRKTT